MNFRNRLPASIAFAALLATASTSLAVPIRYEFAGVMESDLLSGEYPPAFYFPFDVAAGDPLSGYFVYDTDFLRDTNPDPQRGTYPDALIGYGLTIGSRQFDAALPASIISNIAISDDFAPDPDEPDVRQDGVSVFVQGFDGPEPLRDGFTWWSFIQLRSETDLSLFSSTLLPEELPPIEAFDTRATVSLVALNIAEGQGVGPRARITELRRIASVPEPPSVALVLLGLVGLYFFRQRRSRT